MAGLARIARAAWIAGCVALALAVAPAALAQGNPHLLPGGPRPLQERLPAAHAVGIVEIDTVDTGRVRVRTRAVVIGELPDSFEIKRSPVRPPELEPGDTAVLLLRGARSPYVLADEPDEIPRIEDAEVAFWADALGALSTRLGDRQALLSLYTRWLDGPSSTLRQEAARAIAFPDAGFRPLPESFVDGRVAVALDPAKDEEQRVLSARLAASDPRGLEALLGSLPAPGDTDAAGPFREAMRMASMLRLPGARDALLRGLRHPSAEVRLTAASMSLPYVPDEEVRDVLAAHASSQDTELAETAARVLDRATRLIHR